MQYHMLDTKLNFHNFNRCWEKKWDGY